MHYKRLSAICFNLGKSKTLSSGNGLKQDKVLAWSKLKALSEDKLYVDLIQIIKFVFQRVKNNVGKGEVSYFRNVIR